MCPKPEKYLSSLLGISEVLNIIIFKKSKHYKASILHSQNFLKKYTLYDIVSKYKIYW